MSVWAAGDQRLADAVQRKDTAAATALLKQAVDVNAVQPDGASALAWAAHWDDVKLAGQLIEASANVNLANELKITPLMLASANGSAPMVRLLLKAGANPNLARLTGETALMMAARSGNEEAVQLLLAAGADPKAKTARGQTALMWAAAEKHAGAATRLLDAGADVAARNAAYTPPNRNYGGRADRDVARGPRPLLKDNEAMNPEYRRDLMRAREGGKPEGGFTPLLYAVLGGDADTVKVFLDRGGQVNDTSADGTTPLLLSLVKRHEQLAVLLLERGADPNMAGTGYAPLHVAAATNQVAAIKALLARGAKPNTPMEKPVSFTEAFVQGTKVSPGAGWVDIKGATPFMIAARTVNVPAMRELLAAGANPKLTAEDGTTVMMLAAGLGKRADADIGYYTWDEKRAIDAIKLALELGINVNAANQDGETALHAAAYHAANRLVELLVENGANLNLKNWQGQTPLRIAQGHLVCCTTFVRHAGTADLLKKLGADPTVGTQLNFGLGGYAGADGNAASKQQ
jgi:ankyrin repeat protein